MAKHISWGVFCYGGVRPSFYSMTFKHDMERPEVDVTGFEDRSARTLKGPTSSKLGWEGTTDSPYETSLVVKIAEDTATAPFSRILGYNPAAGAPAYFHAEAVARYFTKPFVYGEAGKFNVDITASSGIMWGVALHNALNSGDIDTAGTTFSTPQELGEVGADQILTSNVHLTEPPGAVGTTMVLTVTLQSSVNVGFASPTDRAVFTVFNTAGGVKGHTVSIDGDTDPVTDTWWRLKFVATGTGLSLFPIGVGGIIPKNLA